MLVSAWLRWEHGLFRRRLLEMEAGLKDEGAAAAVKLRRQLEVFHAKLTSHEMVEEELLFPELRRAPGIDRRIVDIFREGHDEVREKLKALIEALTVGNAPMSRFVAGINLVHVLREHMAEEEEVLFPVVESELSADAQKRLGEAAEARSPWTEEETAGKSGRA